MDRRTALKKRLTTAIMKEGVVLLHFALFYFGA